MTLSVILTVSLMEEIQSAIFTDACHSISQHHDAFFCTFANSYP